MFATMLSLVCAMTTPAHAATVDDLITPPQMPDAQFRDITSNETFTVPSGMHKGHTALKQLIPRFENCPVAYALGYNVCLDEVAHPGLIDVWPREGGLGVGMSGPSSANWYGGGFIDLLINDVSPGPRKAKIAVADGPDCRTVRFSWDTPDANVTLDFTATAERERLFLAGRVEPKRRIESLRLSLRCFPSSFATPRDRWIATASRDVEHGRTVTLAPEEFWVFCRDEHFDEAARPKESAGPAAVMFSPLEVRRASVTVGEYAIEVDLDFHRRTEAFKLALWDFHNVANAEALARMRALTEGIAAPEIEVLTEGVGPRTLAVNGKASATIVIPKQAAGQEQRAAQELQDAIVDMSGALLPIKSDDHEPIGNRVFIGDTRQAKDAGLVMDQKLVGEAGFHINALGRDISITAEHPTATLYGVCELLERLGVRWYLPGPLGTVMPEMQTVVVPETDDTQRPSFPMRWIGRGEWGYRNKCNRSIGGGAGDAWGFSIRPGVYHSDYRLLPVKEYYDEHPEYFALVKGERCQESDTKLCVSNPDVVREVAKNMGKLLDEDPSISLIGLAPTDGTNYCECENCVAMDETEERPADRKYSRRMLLFYNAVARELAKTHPEAQILAGAYHWYNQPPQDETIEAEPNLSLVICHYTEYCNMHEIERADCPRNARYLDLLNRWSKLIPDIYFYEYYYTDGFRQLPCNLVHAIRRDMPFYARRGFKGVYTQYGNIWNTCLNYYIAARLLWDVNADVDAILDDFYERFFGEAAAPMKAYCELIDSTLDKTEEHLCTCSGVGRDMRKIFTPEVVAAMRKHCNEATALAQDGLVKARLAKIGAAVEYTERFMAYLDDYYAAARAGDPEERSAAALRALERIETLHEEIKSDRGKWNGVVAPGSYHWRYDLRAARRLAARAKPPTPVEAIGKLPEKWRFALDPKSEGVAGKWFAPDFDDATWEELLVTKHWEYQGHAGYDGYAWYRTPLTLTAEQVDGPVALYFAGVDAEAWVYLDGKQIGHHDGWDVPFTVPMPEELTVAGKAMSLAVRVFDSSANGGMYGPVSLVRGKK